VAATHQNLDLLIEEGRFRKDLYYRLNKFPIQIPALRDRGDDVLLLAKHFINIHNRILGRNVRQISPQAALLLRAYDWPGNVRQIDSVVERILILDDIETIEVKNLPEEIRKTTRGSNTSVSGGSFRPVPLEDLEKEHIMATLKFTNDHRQNAADLLGISRKTLKRKLDSWGKA
jgi:transcriptional regulator with PAS, ATPase and Fis domain